MSHEMYDVIIVGSGPSGSVISSNLTGAGLDCLMLEAGSFFHRNNYPDDHVEATGNLFWSGGVEFNNRANIGMLRPRCVGGGSVVNQALMDRFPSSVFERWQARTGISYFTRSEMNAYYDRVEQTLQIEDVEPSSGNRNTRIFQEGCKRNGYRLLSLRRGQRDCVTKEGNDCVCCLSGCPIDSKQSMPVTFLYEALNQDLDLLPAFTVEHVKDHADSVSVVGTHASGAVRTFRARYLVMAAGAIGNTVILKNSGYGTRIPALGQRFFCHPQTMVMGRYNEPIRAYRGSFQAASSKGGKMKKEGVKLESVFATPPELAMIQEGFGKDHQQAMQQLDHLACCEVAIRDTCPGRIRVDQEGHPVVKKSLSDRDREKRQYGVKVLKRILQSTGAQEISVEHPNHSLHLMGGCPIGTDPGSSVVDERFQLHRTERVFAADSSVFPEAPGENPALTIMAFSEKASEEIMEEVK